MSSRKKSERLRISEEELRDYYIRQELNIREISDRLGSTPSTIRRRLSEFGIERRNAGSNPHLKLQDRDWLYSQYINNELHIHQIAEKIGAGRTTVRKWLIRHSIPIRSKGELRKGKPLPNEQLQRMLAASGKLATADTCLAALHPEIAREWHPTQNSPLTPYDVLPKSGKEVVWHCGEGHPPWSAPVHSRTNGSQCPYCAGKLPTPDNCLATCYPEVAAEWHPSKNGDLTPENVLSKSTYVVWWKCIRGHEWEVAVGSRTGGESITQCPYCVKGRSSLIELQVYCELKKLFGRARLRWREHGPEVDIWLPVIGCGVEVDGSYWHKDKEQLDLRKNRHFTRLGIPLVRLRDHPLLALGLHDVVMDFGKSRFEMCAALVDSIAAATEGPKAKAIAAQYRADGILVAEEEFDQIFRSLPAPPAEESLSARYPDIAETWDYDKNEPLTPEMFTPKVNREVYWRCPNGHPSYQKRIAARTPPSPQGCPVCSGRKVIPVTSLATTHPNVAAHWSLNNVVSSDEVSAGSKKRALWTCTDCGLEYEKPIRDRVHARTSCCRTCANRIRLARSQATRRARKQQRSQ